MRGPSSRASRGASDLALSKSRMLISELSLPEPLVPGVPTAPPPARCKFYLACPASWQAGSAGLSLLHVHIWEGKRQCAIRNTHCKGTAYADENLEIEMLQYRVDGRDCCQACRPPKGVRGEQYVCASRQHLGQVCHACRHPNTCRSSSRLRQSSVRGDSMDWCQACRQPRHAQEQQSSAQRQHLRQRRADADLARTAPCPGNWARWGRRRGMTRSCSSGCRAGWGPRSPSAAGRGR